MARVGVKLLLIGDLPEGALAFDEGALALDEPALLFVVEELLLATALLLELTLIGQLTRIGELTLDEAMARCLTCLRLDDMCNDVTDQCVAKEGIEEILGLRLVVFGLVVVSCLLSLIAMALLGVTDLRL